MRWNVRGRCESRLVKGGFPECMIETEGGSVSVGLDVRPPHLIQESLSHDALPCPENPRPEYAAQRLAECGSSSFPPNQDIHRFG